MNKLACSLLSVSVLMLAGCSTAERDGRVYHGSASPLQGKMGVSFKQVKADPSADATPGATAAMSEEDAKYFSLPPGLLDRTDRPDEPGSEYWMHGQLSPNPMQSKMGVRVERRKK